MISALWDATANILTSGTTGSQTPGFGSWTSVDANNDALVIIDTTVGGQGATGGEVALDVDRSGDSGPADTTKSLTVDTGITGSITLGIPGYLYVPAGGQYQIRNVTDPTNNNAINDVETVTF